MPIYEYECRKCGVFEVNQSIKDDALKRCPTCRCKVEKLISQSAFHLKGGGWYSDAYEKKGGGDSKTSDSGSSSGSSSSTTSKASKDTSSKASGSKKSKSSGKKSKATGSKKG